jgi:hypothetical protein
MEHYFGRYMNTIELLHDMTIIHFPVNYNLVTAPNVSRYVNKNNNRTRRLINRNKRTLRIERPLDFTAEMEGIVRALCVKKTREKYKKTAELLKNHNVSLCRDGYTLDFFYRFAGADAKKFKEIQNRLWSKMAGWREICLTNVTPRTVRLVESVYKPVE